MRFWPRNERRLQRVASFLLIISLISLVLLVIVFRWYRLLAISPPCNSVSNFPIDSQSPPCNQQIGNSGWIVKDDRIRVFPRCLTVMNSRFGSRLNFDWHSGQQKVYSGVLGTLEDQDAFLSIRIKGEDEIEPIFPLLANSSFTRQSVDLGLTYQTVNFENDDFMFSFKISSPFSSSQSINDEKVKLSSSPFFYLELFLANKTKLKQIKTIEFSLGNAREIKNYKNLEMIIFADKVRNDGKVVLAKSKSQGNLQSFIDREQGGFNWQITLEPKASAKTQLVYAGFLEGTAITDSSEEKNRLLNFAYHRWFKNVEEVLEYAFNSQGIIKKETDLFENNFQNQALSAEIKWLLAQAFHSYIGNAWLVSPSSAKSDFNYFVWEGEFKYLNTLDVAHDYGVLEGLYFPWVLKSELEMWQKNAKKDEKGIVIPHDIGNRFYYKGSQTYGIEGANTSGMPVEENANFILLSYWYYHQTQDKQFIKKLAPLIADLVKSLVARDSNENGIADQLVRMTTYDNDGNSALKEAPESSYLGTKQLAAYLSAAEIFKGLDMEKEQKTSFKQAELITGSLKKIYADRAYIPLSLDPTFKERSLFNGKEILGIEEQGFPFINGLFYPVLTGMELDLLTDLKPILADSFQQAYEKSLLKDQSGKVIGLQLAENQGLALGWFSHSVMADFIAKKFFGQKYESWKIYFPLLYDNPYSFADGQYFKEPFYPPQTTLVFYPRGAALFSYLAN